MTSLPDPEIDLLIDLLIPPPTEDWEREDRLEEDWMEEEIDITEFFEPNWLDDAEWDETSF